MFSQCIQKDEKYEVLVPARNGVAKAVLKFKYTCYCYDNHPRQTEFIYITRDRDIRASDLIGLMYKTKYDPMCNHQFLEGFDRTNQHGIQFEPFFGS